MKLEKRSDGGPVEPIEEPTSTGKKPVVVYIMVLFIAAFFLMAWSFASHQKSNTEALGRLQSSVSAMQEVQELQEQVIQLQRELAEVKEQLEQERDAAAATTAAAQEESAATNDKLTALTNLYLLEHAYQSEDYDSCRQIIDLMEREGQPALLTIDDSLEGVVFPSFYNAPRIVYDNLKEAVETRLAEAAQEEGGAE